MINLNYTKFWPCLLSRQPLAAMCNGSSPPSWKPLFNRCQWMAPLPVSRAVIAPSAPSCARGPRPTSRKQRHDNSLPSQERNSTAWTALHLLRFSELSSHELQRMVPQLQRIRILCFWNRQNRHSMNLFFVFYSLCLFVFFCVAVELPLQALSQSKHQVPELKLDAIEVSRPISGVLSETRPWAGVGVRTQYVEKSLDGWQMNAVYLEHSVAHKCSCIFEIFKQHLIELFDFK